MCGRFSVLNRRFSVLLSYGARAGKQVTTEKASSHKKDVKKRKKKERKKKKKKNLKRVEIIDPESTCLLPAGRHQPFTTLYKNVRRSCRHPEGRRSLLRSFRTLPVVLGL